MSASVGNEGGPLGTGEKDGFVGRCGADDFESLIDELFAVQQLVPTGEHFELRLVEVTRYPDRTLPDGFRQPFSLVFESVSQTQPLACECYRFEHDSFGAIELLTTPVTIPTPEGPKVRFEVAFG